MTVKAILSRKGHAVVTIEPTLSLAEAAKLLAERRIGAVIVKGEGDRVAGLLSERDIVRVLAEKGPVALALTVDQVMTPDPKTIRPKALAAEALGRMNAERITCLFVVEDGRPVGILHVHDCLRAGIA